MISREIQRWKGKMIRMTTSLRAPMRGKTLVSILIWATSSLGIGELKYTYALKQQIKFKLQTSLTFPRCTGSSKDKLYVVYISKRHIYILLVQRASSWHIRKEHDHTAHYPSSRKKHNIISRSIYVKEKCNMQYRIYVFG